MLRYLFLQLLCVLGQFLKLKMRLLLHRSDFCVADLGCVSSVAAPAQVGAAAGVNILLHPPSPPPKKCKVLHKKTQVISYHGLGLPGSSPLINHETVSQPQLQAQRNPDTYY